MKYTREVLMPVVAGSLSFAEVLRKLGLRQSGGSQSNIVRWVRLYELDTSHFLGQRRQKGKPSSNRRHWFEILILRSPNQRREHGNVLRRALIESGIPHICNHCGCPPEWNGHPLTLQVEHKDGCWRNCLKENLEFLCPNCHSQTKTWGAKKVCGYGGILADTLV